MRSTCLKRARYIPKDKVERGLLLDVVVAEGAAILELLSSEDEALLVRGDTVQMSALSVPYKSRVGTQTPPCPVFWP